MGNPAFRTSKRPKPSSGPSRRRHPAGHHHLLVLLPSAVAVAVAAMDGDPSRQVRVRFVTKLPPPLRAPPAAIAVPADLTRMGLSEIVNSLLAAGERLRTTCGLPRE